MKKHTVPKAELSNWYKDRYQHVLVQRKIFALITLIALGTTFMSLFIIAQLIPQKSIEPYVIQIDPKTGITETVDPLTAKELTSNEAVNNYFIVQYIRAREGYNATDLVHNYNIVRLMSEQKNVYPRFLDAAGPNNPESNIARIGTLGTRTITFKSISYLSPQIAQARVTITEKGLQQRPTEYHRIILVAFEYVKMNLSTEERYLNPLGFRVNDYQINEDVLQQ